MQEAWIQHLGQEEPLEEGMTTHYSILAWRIPWTEETGGLQSIGLQESQTQLKRLSTHAYTERKRGQSLSTTCKHSEKRSSTSQKVNCQVGPVQSAT